MDDSQISSNIQVNNNLKVVDINDEGEKELDIFFKKQEEANNAFLSTTQSFQRGNPHLINSARLPSRALQLNNNLMESIYSNIYKNKI